MIPTAPLGGRGVEVTRIGLGTAPLGNMFQPLDDDQATATIAAAWDAGIRFFDVAPLYGEGLSEKRLGAALAERPRDEYVLSTKVGRLLVDGEIVFDFSRAGVRRSLEESLERLGLERVDVLLVHDPEHHMDQALREALPAVRELRDEGVVGAIGAGMNYPAELERIVRDGADCVLMAGRYTLIDRSGLGLLDACAQLGVDVIAGGVFNSGLLAGGTTFDYRPAPQELLDRAQAVFAECSRRGVSATAAALQFPLTHPAVKRVLIGARSAAELREDVEAFSAPLDDQTVSAIAASGVATRNEKFSSR
jgi:D-threo-aldose 1-dehydrogenase